MADDEQEIKIQSIETDLKQKYSKMEIEVTESTINARKNSWFPNVVMSIPEVGLFEFLAKNTNSFEKVEIPDNSYTIVMGNKAYLYLATPDWHMEAPAVDFIMYYKGVKLKVHFVDYWANVRTTLGMTTNDTFDSFLENIRSGKYIPLYSKHQRGMKDWSEDLEAMQLYSEEKLSEMWDLTLAHQIISFCGSQGYFSYFSSREVKGMENAVPLVRLGYSGRVLMIEPFNSTIQLQKIVDNNWKDLSNFLTFTYYYHYGAVMIMLPLHSVKMEFSASYLREPWMNRPPLGEVIFRNVEPILLDHAAMAERSNVPTTSYLSFYHIMEYFFERVSRKKLSEQIGEIVTLPDFLSRKEYYTERIIREYGNKLPRNVPEREKLFLVLDTLVPIATFENIESHAKNQLQQDITLDGGHVLDAIDIEDKNGIHRRLAKRIYGLRCSIVHSNPDFEEEQKPISMTEKNMQIIHTENSLMKRIALEIIANSTIKNL